MILSVGDLMIDMYRDDDKEEVGGSALNFAYWMSRFGRKCGVLGRVGCDKYGDEIISFLKDNDIFSHVIKDNLHPTGRIIITRNDCGLMSFECFRGANAHFQGDDVRSDILKDADWLQISGHTFKESLPRKAAKKTINVFLGSFKGISVDAASFAHINEVGTQSALKEYKGANLVFLNYKEGIALTGFKDPEKIIEAMLAEFDVVALKLGNQGCMAALRSNKDIVKVEAENVKEVDSNGAGDAFDAAFLHMYLEGRGLFDCLKIANKLGAAVASKFGPHPEIEKDELDEVFSDITLQEDIFSGH